MNIEELSVKLVALASKPTLSQTEHKKARELMRSLKAAGLSNEEISQISKERWSPSTVKGYTKGVKSPASSPWQDTVSLLNDLISIGISLDDIDTVLTVTEDLKSREVSLTEVIDVLCAVDSAGVDLTTLVNETKELTESGLSMNNVKEAIELKSRLEAKGLLLDSLSVLVKLASTYGDAQKVLEAVSAYGSLEDIKAEISIANKELQSLNAETTSVRQNLQETQDAFAELAKPLEAYKKAVGSGFGEEELDGLAILADKFGGSKAVFQIVKGYVDYSEINNKVSQAQSELITLESEVNKLNAEYCHLETAIEMCQTLISDHKFGLDVISTTLSLAGKYGEPLIVLKSVEAYGKLELMQEELTRLESEITKRKELLAQLEGKNNEALRQFEVLNATAMKTGAEVTKVENKLQENKALHKIISFINDPALANYQEYGQLAVAILKSILKWVTNNENHFLYPNRMKSALQDLITELGGD